MQCDIVSRGEKVGFLQWERQGLYTSFYGRVETRSVARVVARFEGGSCALGVPVPEKGEMVLRASMPTSRLPKGKILEGTLEELRQEKTEGWGNFPGGFLGGVCFPRGLRRDNVLRFPWKLGERVPAEEVLLLYRHVEEGGKDYLELILNPDGSPGLPP